MGTSGMGESHIKSYRKPFHKILAPEILGYGRGASRYRQQLLVSIYKTRTNIFNVLSFCQIFVKQSFPIDAYQT